MIVYFAGCDAGKQFVQALAAVGVRNYFFSYYYLKESGIKDIETMFDTAKLPSGKIKIMVDSGAFTLLLKIWKGKKSSKAKVKEIGEQYFCDYADWVVHNQKNLTSVVNLDLDTVFGEKVITDWNMELLKHVKDTEICFVWHKYEHGLAGWRKFCKTYNYVGCSGVLSGRIEMGELIARIGIAKDYGVRVHGLGMTRFRMLDKTAFFSVDSTSWLSALKFGSTHLTVKNNMYTYAKEMKTGARLPYLRQFKEAGLTDEDIALIRKDNWRGLMKLNAVGVKQKGEIINKLGEYNQWYRRYEDGC